MAKIIYQWCPWAYMHQASLSVQKNLTIKIDTLVGYDSFEDCWNKAEPDDIMVLATENSYAWSIYENLYRFLKYDVKIIGEHDMEIDHCLVSHESHINQITKVYSHFKALPQCYEYLKSKGIHNQIIHPDTAGAWKMISETKEPWASAICSRLAWEMYGLNILDEGIQDQKNNTTRFSVIAHSEYRGSYLQKVGKTSIIFEAKDAPSSLYTCLWCFASNEISITKLESLPNVKTPFTYITWIDIQGHTSETHIQEALTLLEDHTISIKIIGEY